MKTTPKLRRYITISLGSIILIMIAAYSLLVYYALFSSIVETISYDFMLKARDFERSYRENKVAPLPETRYLRGYLGWEDTPGWLKRRYRPETLAHGRLIMEYLTDSQVHNGQEFFFLAMAYTLHDQKRLYLVETYAEKDTTIPDAFTNIKRTTLIMLGLGIGFILLVGLALRYFFNKISTSINALTTWANSLNRKKLEQSHPDFRFKEINQLADLIQNALGNLHEALSREHHFLQSASHELRTPIAVIRTNMDLLERIQPNPGDKESKSYQRIRRAVDNMNQLIETLLWLSRKEEAMPPPESVEIDRLVNELVRESRYLLAGKDIDLNLDMVEAKATLPRIALGIALKNLIRNAFQYTHRGSVEIRVTHTMVTITNIDRTRRTETTAGSDFGFGLGLILVEQICKKLNLPYENQIRSGENETKLQFSDSKAQMP